jgi:endonuclease/exonuclease/phosphatase family metal-dependent hydrolase
MRFTLGTFNLNNLFSRFTFQGQVDDPAEGLQGDVAVSYSFTPGQYRFRKYMGRMVMGKPDTERQTIANRILAMNADVLAVQEVEDIDTLRAFARDDLNGLYPYQILVEGNDDRLIDLGLLSKLPIGAITSWKEAIHETVPERPVFSRDMLQVEILDPISRQVVLTVFNHHLKSHFVPANENPVAGAEKANKGRQRQCEVARDIIAARMASGGKVAVVGDMNDPPDSNWLAPMFGPFGLGLVNALADPNETRPAKADNPPPATRAWTHRFKEDGQPAKYEMYDQIWVSPGVTVVEAWIDRRTKHSGDGSDHDPAWVQIEV